VCRRVSLRGRGKFPYTVEGGSPENLLTSSPVYDLELAVQTGRGCTVWPSAGSELVKQRGLPAEKRGAFDFRYHLV
jgi:hypothetical protein